MNQLYYGDNLDVLRRYIADESVDLIYLDPPFKSNQDYNVLFAEHDGTRAAAQIKAFEDTWQWDEGAAAAYEDVVERGGRVSEAMQAFRIFLGDSDMLAYLAMMAPRLVELRRVLKATGSIYLHCDPTASHYLKMLMDAVFGPQRFRNEIIWRRADPKGHAFSRYPSTHDVLLYCAKGEAPTWHTQYRGYDPDYLESHYGLVEEGTGRRYTLSDCTNPNKNRPNLTYEWNGITKVWRWTKERMQRHHEEGRLVYTKTGAPRYKRYLDEMSGTVVTTVWDDVPFVNSQAQERLGYPTQKPEALLERIIRASSNEGDVVLDPFCGCGTAVAVAHQLKRQWIGIDITHLAINLIRHRLRDAFGDAVLKAFKVVGEPVSVPDAAALAASDPYQFQWWALGLVGARPAEQKKGADRGVDGRLYFHDDRQTRQIIFSVKAGSVTAAHVRDLRGVVDREKASIGALISFEEPTKAMRAEAAGGGFYESVSWAKKYPRLQLLTVAELLEGKGVAYPPSRQVNRTFKKAPRARTTAGEQLTMAAETPAEYTADSE